MLLILFGVAVLTNQAFAAGKYKFITRIRHKICASITTLCVIYVQLIKLHVYVDMM